MKIELIAIHDILSSMKNRSYQQYCGLAYALDIIGERWTMLIIRELITGPRRFTDLLEGLPGISTNLLSERLKSLEGQGLLYRRILPPPAGSTVYELTPLGLALEKTLIELGKWGSQFVPPAPGEDSLLNVGSYALTLKTFFRPEKAQGVDDTYELHIDDEVLHVKISEGEVKVRQGEAPNADLVLHTDMPTYLGMLTGQVQAEGAVSKGLVQIKGDSTEEALEALTRFLRICGVAISQ